MGEMKEYHMQFVCVIFPYRRKYYHLRLRRSVSVIREGRGTLLSFFVCCCNLFC